MRILGVNCLNHDAAISVIEDAGQLVKLQPKKHIAISFVDEGIVIINIVEFLFKVFFVFDISKIRFY